MAKRVFSLDEYTAETLKEFMQGVHLKLVHISKSAGDAWIEIEEAEGLKDTKIPQMRCEAIGYLADSMSREVDLLFGLLMANVQFVELTEIVHKSRTKKGTEPCQNQGANSETAGAVGSRSGG